jgi:hypothetical protein
MLYFYRDNVNGIKNSTNRVQYNMVYLKRLKKQRSVFENYSTNDSKATSNIGGLGRIFETARTAW